jgi:hypothetical protein
MGQPIKQGRGHAVALEDLAPLAEREVAGDENAAAFVPVGEHLEQQFRAASAEADVSQFIDDQQFDFAQHLQRAFQPVVLLGFFQLVHQRLGRVELHALSCPARRLSKCHRVMDILWNDLQRMLDQISSSDVGGFFSHCGYKR